MAKNTTGTQRQAAGERVIVYVDGLRRLAENLLLRGQVLVASTRAVLFAQRATGQRMAGRMMANDRRDGE